MRSLSNGISIGAADDCKGMKWKLVSFALVDSEGSRGMQGWQEGSEGSCYEGMEMPKTLAMRPLMVRGKNIVGNWGWYVGKTIQPERPGQEGACYVQEQALRTDGRAILLVLLFL